MEQEREKGRLKEQEKEQLQRELQARLERHQEQTEMGEADFAEIKMLLRLLQQLDPQPEPDAARAYQNFEQHYLPKLQEETAAEEQGQDGTAKEQTQGRAVSGRMQKKAGRVQGRNVRRRLLRFGGMAAAVILLLFAVLNVGTYASSGVDFFTFLRQGGTGRSFVALGEDGQQAGESAEGMGYGFTNGIVCTSWEDVEDVVREQILIPEKSPKDMSLIKIRYWGGKYDLTVRAAYQSGDGREKLQVWIEKYSQRPTWQSVVHPEADFLEEEQIGELLCQVYVHQDEVIMYFYRGTELYTIFGNCTRQEIADFVGNMK